MSDELFDEIQDFLDQGGEPAEMTPAQQLTAAMTQWAEAMRPHFEAMAAAVREIAAIIVRAIKAFVRQVAQWLGPFIIGLRRDQLRRRLEAMRLPRWVALWIAAWWPAHWLPQLSFEGR